MASRALTSKDFRRAAWFCLILLLGIFIAGALDASDGVVRMRRSYEMISAARDPERFRGVLMLNYGLYGMFAFIGAIASWAGVIGMSISERAAERAAQSASKK